MFRFRIQDLIAFSLLLAASANCDADESPFREYVSKEGRFSVEMPIPPEPESNIENSGFKVRFVVAELDRIVYSIQFVDPKGLPENLKEIPRPQEAIKAFRTDHRGGEKFEDDKEITLGKNKVPGREYRVTILGYGIGDDKYVREQIFIAEKRIYVVTVETERGGKALDCEAVERFFSSFKMSTEPAKEESREDGFVFHQGRFTATFPAKPKFKEEIGKSSAVSRYSSKSREATYSVQYVNLTPNQRGDLDPQEWLLPFRSKARPNAKFEDDSEISLGPQKVPGREYLAVIPKKDKATEYVREQLFLSGNRLFIVYADVAASKSHLDHPQVKRFFSTFQITN